jgi:RNA polymerase sigma-70 factor (ECF subfamily)
MAQEVFLRVYGARDRYRGSGAFSTWLFRIVLNVARSAHRRRGRRRPPQPLDAREPASPAAGADEAVEQEEQSRAVEAAVAALPPRLRDVLVLRQFGELTFAQVARVTGLPESTVKSRVRAALDRLRAELKRRGIDQRGIEP